VLLNDGKGKFPSASNLGQTPDRTYTADLADVDGDGKLDVVVGNDAPDPKLVYRNVGNGRFELAGSFGQAAWRTRYLTLADVNRDGRIDVVVANRGGPGSAAPGKGSPSYVCLNDGKGNFPGCRPLPTQSATTIVAADFDNDGAIDLAVPHRDGGRNVMLWNDGKGNFADSNPFGPPASSSRTAAASDFNGDRMIDIVLADDQGVFLYVNRGNRTFSEARRIANNSAVNALAVADLNRDGKTDIVLGCEDIPGSVLFNDGAAMIWREVRWNDGKGRVYGIAVADLDRDGWLDIVAARSGAQNGVWFSGRSDQ
jgi:hypothetical protein